MFSCQPPRIIHIEKLVKTWKFLTELSSLFFARKGLANQQKKLIQANGIYMILYITFQN